MMATDDLALRRLQAFDYLQGEIVIREMGLPVVDWFGSPYKLRLDGSTATITIDKDCNAADAALYLMKSLDKCLGKSAYWEAYELYLLQEHGIIANLEDHRARSRAMVDNMSSEIGPILETILIVGSIVNEPTDWVITISEVADGNWGTAIGFLPTVPAAAYQAGKGVKIVMPSGATFRAATPQAAALVKAVMNGVNQLTPAQAAAMLKAARMSIQQRVNMIQAKKFKWLPFRTRTSRKSEQLRNDIINYTGRPMPDDLYERTWSGIGRHTPQVHHIFPLEHSAWFMAHGIDVNNPKYLVWMRRSEHSRLHGRRDNIDPYTTETSKYNERWKEFQEAEDARIDHGYDEYTISEIENFVDSIAEEFHVTVDPARPDIWSVPKPSE